MSNGGEIKGCSVDREYAVVVGGVKVQVRSRGEVNLGCLFRTKGVLFNCFVAKLRQTKACSPLSYRAQIKSCEHLDRDLAAYPRCMQITPNQKNTPPCHDEADNFMGSENRKQDSSPPSLGC